MGRRTGRAGALGGSRGLRSGRPVGGGSPAAPSGGGPLGPTGMCRAGQRAARRPGRDTPAAIGEGRRSRLRQLPVPPDAAGCVEPVVLGQPVSRRFAWASPRIEGMLPPALLALGDNRCAHRFPEADDEPGGDRDRAATRSARHLVADHLTADDEHTRCLRPADELCGENTTASLKSTRADAGLAGDEHGCAEARPGRPPAPRTVP